MASSGDDPPSGGDDDGSGGDDDDDDAGDDEWVVTVRFTSSKTMAVEDIIMVDMMIWMMI